MASVSNANVKNLFSSVPTEFNQLVRWEVASACPHFGDTDAMKQSMKYSLERSASYCAVLLVVDPAMDTIVDHMVSEIGSQSRSLLNHCYEGHWDKENRAKRGTGSGTYSITTCICPYKINIRTNQATASEGSDVRAGGIFFDEAIREATVSLFCKLVTHHPIILKQRKEQVEQIALLPSVLSSIISDYETDPVKL